MLGLVWFSTAYSMVLVSLQLGYLAIMIKLTAYCIILQYIILPVLTNLFYSMALYMVHETKKLKEG